jgi:RNA polymerase sigma-70 factor, ECF subfamily
MATTDSRLETDLIRRIIDGERHLFHELIRPCERSIYLLLFSMLKSEADAEDASQETVLKVFQNLHRFRGEAQFRTWVLSIARNEGLGRLRRLTSRREESLDAATEDQPGDYTPAILTSWREIPIDALEQKELSTLLRQTIEKLPDIYRNIVILRDIEEMDIRETATVLGISEGAVKVRLHRARAMLQRELAPKLKAFAPRRRGFFGGRA